MNHFSSVLGCSGSSVVHQAARQQSRVRNRHLLFPREAAISLAMWQDFSMGWPLRGLITRKVHNDLPKNVKKNTSSISDLPPESVYFPYHRLTDMLTDWYLNLYSFIQVVKFLSLASPGKSSKRTLLCHWSLCNYYGVFHEETSWSSWWISQSPVNSMVATAKDTVQLKNIKKIL